jgi:tRNA U34 5-carboxymethylaminomethyl modifying GTPase MnmE/TrmE
VRAAVNALESIVGRVDREAVLDQLFASFCIGK